MELILTTFLNIAIFQGIVLGIIILKSPIFKSNANKYLAYAIFSLSFSLLNYVLDEAGAYHTIPVLRLIDIIDSAFLFPVFIFLYVVHQTGHSIKNSRKNMWLFMPYLYSLICSILDDEIVTNSLETPSIYQISIEIIQIIQVPMILLFIPGILIYTYRFIKLSNNSEEKRWLTHLWILTFGLFGSWILAIFSGLILDYEFTPIMTFITVIATLIIHWTVYFGILKFKLAKDKEEIKTLINKRKRSNKNQSIAARVQPQIAAVKKESPFTQENPYFKRLEELCVKDQIYKDSTLDRDKIAEKLGISSGYVSQLVNTITGDNFAAYINHYRVEAVKQLILDPEFDNYSLLAIGLECGFSSKTTFYNTFKRICGVTPNAYRKMNK